MEPININRVLSHLDRLYCDTLHVKVFHKCELALILVQDDAVLIKFDWG